MSLNHPPGPPLPQSAPADIDALYTALESYSWHSDPEFQAGLHAILGPSPSEPSPSSAGGGGDAQQTQDLTLHARCFYYTRKFNVSVDFDAYKAWREQQPPTALSPLAPSTLPTPLPDSAPSSAETTPRKAKGDAARTNGDGMDTSTGGAAGEGAEQRQQGSGDAAGAEGRAAADNPAYPPSFAEIVELIKTGQPIPGIKEIPDTVLTGQATEATKSKRKKPWEERLGTSDSHNVPVGNSRDEYFGEPSPGV